ncbi:winged helix-turn-helix domain-containing protein [Nonomuraea sp. NPDC049709]|uniref:helix-turn-helix domain-containing protein n=1 Tax=Nonomuraea sp. NPDC049709 TaxID=3154736 RepID=UPI003442D660
MRYPDGGGLSAKARVKREQVRFKAADMFQRGMTPPQVARALRVTPSSANAWHRAWKKSGKQALASKGPGGSTCRLNDQQIQTLEAELDRGPAAHGWDDQSWSLSRVATVIKERFGIDYTPRGVSYLLHRIGWSPQAPVHRATERDEDAITTWVKETWPHIKGRPPSAAPGSASSTNQGKACARRKGAPGPDAGRPRS